MVALTFFMIGCEVSTNQTGMFTLSLNTSNNRVSEDKDKNILMRYEISDIDIKDDIEQVSGTELEDSTEQKSGTEPKNDTELKSDIELEDSTEQKSDIELEDITVQNSGTELKDNTDKKNDAEQKDDSKQEDDIEIKDSIKPEVSQEQSVNTEEEDKKESTKPEEKEEEQKKMVTLLAVGDNLLHQKVIDSGKKEDGNYNYDHLFERLKWDIKAADIAVINQETIFGTKKMGYSGYPRFCSPTAVGRAISKAGFDIVLHANNHTMDKGVDGILTTLKYWDQYSNITPLGIYRSQEEANQITYVDKNGITIAFLNYTYGLNGNALPSSKSYLVNIIDRNKIKSQLKQARKKADFVVVFPHWGSEYVYEANRYQKEYATFFNEQGVDLIIGTHPHVLQPIEWIEGKTGHKTLVYYSLGNYISSMDYTDRMLGGIANVTIIKEGKKTYIKNASITPIVTHYERGGDYNFTVYKLTDYTQKLASKHYILKGKWGRDFSLKALKKLTNDIVGDFIKK